MSIRLYKSDLFFPFLITIFYLLSRYVTFRAGVKFDASSIDHFYQYLDIYILKNDLLRGVFFQHSQPPLFNLFLGAILKFFPTNYELAFSLLFHIFGFVTYFLIYKILCLVKFNSWVAFTLASAFMVFPETILYEKWLFYTWPIATLLTFATYTLLLYEKTHSLRYGFLFIIVISMICLTRSAFHLVYLVICFLLVFSIPTPTRKIICLISIGAFLVVGSVFLKNAILFGFFGSSSWMGMSLWRMTEHCVVTEKVTDTEVTSVRPFSRIASYPKKYQQVPVSFSKIPVLSSELKENKKKNMNHYGYIKISQEYLRESLNKIVNDPLGYKRTVINAIDKYVHKPSWSYYYMKDNALKINKYINSVSNIKKTISIPIILYSLVLVIICSIIYLFKYTRSVLNKDGCVYYIFIGMTIVYLTVICNFFEYGENHRFRVQIDSILFIATIIAIGNIWFFLQRIIFKHFDFN